MGILYRSDCRWTLSILVLFILGLSFSWARCAELSKHDYPIQPVDFTRVHFQDSFWAPRLETNRTVTIPFAMKMNEETGRVDNFRKAARLKSGPYQGKRYNDSDVYKVMEGAAYTLMLHPDPRLQQQLRELIRFIAAAQEGDGYLYTARTVDPAHPAPGTGPERWSLLRVSHELYNVGHMYEAAVAYYQATGEKAFLDIAYKNADLLLRVFGPNKLRAFPGHQEIEIGLAKLYRVSGEQRYLELARFFLDQRGRGLPLHVFPPDSPFNIYNEREYLQDHKPVLEQTEAAGHAVRAAYMYAGMADVAALGGFDEYARASDTLWENVVGKKMYLTGGIGARENTEGFGNDYELPNAAYAETCAAIGNALWNERLFLLHGEAKYIDVLERVIYNGLISGVSLSGDRFFYQNPLESSGKYGRSAWFEVACCPGNLTRFLPSLPGYVYAVKEDSLYINLYVASSAQVELAGQTVTLNQRTRYPWDGAVTITVNPEKSGQFTIRIRIPGWVQDRPVPGDLYRYLDQSHGTNPSDIKSQKTVILKVNGQAIPLALEKGYIPIRRTWRKGDQITLNLLMPVRRVLSHERIRADAGKVALERGPLVYCAEGVDNGGHVCDLALPDSSSLKAEFRPDLLNGLVVLKGKVTRPGATDQTGEETKVIADNTAQIETRDKDHDKTKNDDHHNIMVDFMAIPYYAWAHRGEGEMAVWLLRLK